MRAYLQAMIRASRLYVQRRRPGKLRSLSATPAAKTLILAKSRGHCYLCGVKLRTDKKAPILLRFSIDHLRALDVGGRHTRGNLVAACIHCNSLKRTLSITELLGDRDRFRNDKREKIHRELMKGKLTSDDRAALSEVRERWREDRRYWFEVHPLEIPRDLSTFEVFVKDFKHELRRARRAA